MVTATPTIHLNGTGRDNLQAEYRSALEALQAARKALENITVHMRDYYVQDNGRMEYEIALREKWARVHEVEEIEADMLKLFLATEDK